MKPDNAPFITWPQLLAHLEQLWGRPRADFLPDLLAHIRHDIIVLIEPVLTGAKILLNFYTLAPSQPAQLQHCVQVADEWLYHCRATSDDCLAKQLEPNATCECYLQALGPIFSNSAELLASLAAVETTAGLDAEAGDILATVNKSLRQIDLIATSHKQSDLSWLKEIFDEQERRRHPSK